MFTRVLVLVSTETFGFLFSIELLSYLPERVLVPILWKPHCSLIHIWKLPHQIPQATIPAGVRAHLAH
jgi:hypothetical protein